MNPAWPDSKVMAQRGSLQGQGVLFPVFIIGHQTQKDVHLGQTWPRFA